MASHPTDIAAKVGSRHRHNMHFAAGHALAQAIA